MANYCVWVGGLRGVVQEKDLTELFSTYGRVLHIKIVRDQETKKSKHCAFVVYGDERTAEHAAVQANGNSVLGSIITTRGPAAQRLRGHKGQYDGKIGYVPTKENDIRPFTDCIHYVTGSCTKTPCPYRHSIGSSDPSVPVCDGWLSDSCTNKYCGRRHPGPNAPLLTASGPVLPVYALSNLQIDDDDVIRLASASEHRQISSKFEGDWARAKGDAPAVKAIFVIQNEGLDVKWKTYKASLPSYYQYLEEDHYHGTKLCCDISSKQDICTSLDCSVCRISESGFSRFKIRQNIPHFQRFGQGFYLAPKSSKCHDYTQGAHTYRAMLLCRVFPGNKYKLKKDDSSLQGPPSGYHSIYGEAGRSLNYEEIVLPNADAILPKYIIVYRKDGEHKIAK